MKKVILVTLIITGIFISAFSQSRKDLEEQRKKTLEEISYVDNMLNQTTKKKNESLNELKIIGKKLNLREKVLRGLQDEIILLSDRIELNEIAIDMMESDLRILKEDYRKAVLNSFLAQKGNNEVAYIISARDFNQGYKRLKYLEQMAKFRRSESETILELKSEIEVSKKKMESDLKKISELKSKEEVQKYLLQDEQEKQEKVVKSLGNKEKQLQKELEEKKRIARKIEDEINRMIDSEKRKRITDLTPEQRLIGEGFQENKGRLPWPVERGIITSHFGVQSHPVLKYVTEDNIDIEITSSGETPVRSVFKGEVAKVFSIRGANMAIIIRHGKYLTVYQNIINVRVKPGDKVETKQGIGNVFTDPDNGNKAILKFMVFEEKVKMDPELWISKKN